jgi:hypothetical protein
MAAKKVDGDRCAVLTFLPTQEEGSGKQQLSGWQNSPVQQGMLDLMSDVKNSQCRYERAWLIWQIRNANMGWHGCPRSW